MGQDVKEPTAEPQVEVKEEPVTSEPESQPVKETPTEVKEEPTPAATPEEVQPEPTQEKTVPYQALSAERQRRKELQRKLAALQGQQGLKDYDPNDLEAVMAHPYVQELIIKQAKQELTDYTRGVLDSDYPNFPAVIRKAILANVRGFVNETTTDIESAKIDILDYIEKTAEETEAGQPIPAPETKSFPVAATNTGETETAARPAEIAKILDKPVDSWSDEEVKLVADYSKNSKK